MKTLNDITLYDLMADDLDIWVTKNKKFGVNIEIDDKDGFPVVREQGLTTCAADSFADFCRNYLAFYDRAVA